MAKKQSKKKFNYGLESVLKVREIREKQQQEKLGKAQRQLFEEQQKEQSLKTFREEKFQELRKQMSPGETLDFSDMLLRKTHLDKLKKDVKKQVKVRKKAAKEKEKERVKLVKTSQKKKVIEKDKEHKHKDWKKYARREETKFMDDISNVGFSRKRQENRRNST